MKLFSEKESQILRFLAEYKFLTLSQFSKLGLVKSGQSTNYLGKLLKELRSRRKPNISCIEFKGTYKFDQKEYVYYLTLKGEQLLVDELGLKANLIRRPIASSVFYERDYHHRKVLIDFHIGLNDLFVKQGINLLWFDTYFDFDVTTSSKRTALTKIFISNNAEKYIIPDAIFCIQINQSDKKLFCLEVHLGINDKRINDQIRNHVRALINGAISTKYFLSSGWKVLYLFNETNIKESVKAAFESNVAEQFHPYFEFITLKELDPLIF